MCAPLALGAATLATGAASSISKYQSAQAQTAAANRGAVNNYKYQLKMRSRNWDATRYRYGQQIADYKQALSDNSDAANRAYAAEQERLNNVFRSAKFNQQAKLIELVRNQGKTAAANRSGRSALRIEQDMAGIYGRGQATVGESLFSAQKAFASRGEGIRRQLLSANNKAYSNVAVAPQPGIAPPAPIMQTGPSGLDLALGIVEAGVAGYSTYDKYKNPQIN